MLKKLMKHEWKNSWKIPTFLIGALLVISVFSGLTFAAPIWEEELTGMEILTILVWLLYYFALIAMSLGVTLYLAVRFYKTMFTDEGYLTHTLPVTARQLLISKMLPMAGWMALSTVAIFASLGIFGSMAAVFLKPEGVGFWEYVMEGLSMTELVELVQESGMGKMMLSVLCMMLVGVFSGPMMIISSVSLGQLISKHRILGSIGAYFVINTAVQTISSVAMVPMMFRMASTEAENVLDVMTPMYFIMSLIMAAVTVGLYFISEYMVRKKLNLD